MKKKHSGIGDLQDYLELMEEGVDYERLKNMPGASVRKIPIDLIVSPGFHDRKHVDKKSLEMLAKNIQSVGLIHPIVVRKREDNKYERIVGYRRLEAVKLLGWKEIDAIVVDVPREKVIAMILSENIHRENLSDIEKVEAQVAYLSHILSMSVDRLISFLNRIYNYKRGRVSNLAPKEMEAMKKVEIFLDEVVGQSIMTFLQRVQLLRLPEYLKEAARKLGLGYRTLIEIENLTRKGIPEEKVMEVLDKAIEQGWNGAQIINELRASLEQSEEEKVRNRIASEISFIRRLVSRVKMDGAKAKEIEKLLSQIKDILQS